ncbi:hypothetical protein AB1K62_07715 [Parasphingorhabdus sp. JC815]|uniref:hypothetical protein n=1 Tax=Parasphingorhabdus sp. JC815 TaxID=3232140 RepID=UPI0034577EB9
MKLFLLILAISQAASVPAREAPTDMNEIHKREISCVATFAIVASEQERGIDSALRYPILTERGRTYAGQVGEKVMAETGQSREQVRDAILAAVADQQTKAKDAAEPDEIVSTEMKKCLPLLDVALPGKPKPTLNQCAAMMQLAYEKVYEEENLSKMAQDLKTLAFVLDSRAREKMRGEGKSGNESDIILTQIREEMKIAQPQQASQEDLDIDHCFLLAAPENKGQNFEH